MLKKETLEEIRCWMKRIEAALDIISHMEYGDAMNSILELCLEVWNDPDWRPVIEACKAYLTARTDFLERVDFGGINLRPYLFAVDPSDLEVRDKISCHVYCLLGHHCRRAQDLIFDNYRDARTMIHLTIPSIIIAQIIEEEKKVMDMEREYYSKGRHI